MRWWTADWHLNSEIVCKTFHRPWKTAEEMNNALILNFRKQLSDYDTVIHIGDLIQSDKDHGIKLVGNELAYEDIIDDLNSQMAEVRHNQLFCIEGNHDANNDVPFICRSMKTRIDNYNVTVGHYPTWKDEAVGTFYCYGQKYGEEYDRAMHRKHPAIHICGHVHNAWKVAYDKRYNVLNINVGIDAHNYKMLSDAELAKLISKAITWWNFMQTSPDHWFGEYSFADWEKDIVKQKQVVAAEKKL